MDLGGLILALTLGQLVRIAGRLGRFRTDTSPASGAPPSLFHRAMALAFISASVGCVFVLRDMHGVWHQAGEAAMGQHRQGEIRPAPLGGLQIASRMGPSTAS
jgi:hypothetical protein